MAGHRDDGTYADDKAHHPNRKVDFESILRRQSVAGMGLIDQIINFQGNPANPMTNAVPDLYDPGDMGEYNHDARLANATIVDESDYGVGNKEGSCSCGGSCSECKKERPF